MEQQKLTLATILIVLVVGTVGFVGVQLENTGDVIQTTSSIRSRNCECVIGHYDGTGDLVQTSVNKIRAKTQGKRESCQLLCEQKFGKVTKNMKRTVLGYQV